MREEERVTPRAADAQAAVLRRKSDDELVTLTRKGSPAAFEALFRRYSPPLVRYSERMLGSNGAQAEDVVQEVMVAARAAIDTDQGPVNVGPWLYRATRNRCLNHIRDESAAKRPPTSRNGYEEGQEYLEKIALRVPSAAHEAERRAELRQLVDDLHELPESQRTALVLRELEGHGYEEVAESMGTTVPSVKSLLVRARLALAEIAEARELQCEDIQRALARAEQKLGGLRPAERAHVRGCKDCSRARKQMRATSRSLAALSPIGLSLSLKGALATAFNGSGGAVATAGGAATAGAASLGGAGAAAGGLLAGGVLAKSVIATVAVGLVAAGSVVVPARNGDNTQRETASTPALAPIAIPPPSSPGDSPNSTSSGSSKLEPKAGSDGSDAVAIVAPSAVTEGAGSAVVIQEVAAEEEPEATPETRTRTVPEDNSAGTRGRGTPSDSIVTSPPAVPERQAGAEAPSATGNDSDDPPAGSDANMDRVETAPAEAPAQP